MDNQKKVIVAMSGGVDSTVAAYLLKEQGFEITGLHLILYKQKKTDQNADISRIKHVAKIIGIPLVIKDVRREFKKKVIDYFLREYKNGRTPNPCVVCNQEIKFKFLFQELSKLKADYVATGHYARKREIKNQKSKIKMYGLYEARDINKDQSYFLYTLQQKQLAKIIFPLGEYTKEEVKKLSKKLKLPIDEGEESQNVCFISDKYPDLFLKKNIKMKAGDIIDIERNIIGKHRGLPLYTLGQRRGIDIGGKGPYFVVGKKFKKNQLIVNNSKTTPELFQSSAILGSVNWVGIKPASTSRRRGEPKLPIHILSQTRYHNPKVNAIIKPYNMKHEACNRIYKIEFEKPQRAITPGQSAVFYAKKGEVIGGGIIK